MLTKIQAERHRQASAYITAKTESELAAAARAAIVFAALTGCSVNVHGWGEVLRGEDELNQDQWRRDENRLYHSYRRSGR